MPADVSHGLKSLSGKITALVVVLAFVSAASIGMLGYYESVQMSERTGVEKLQAEARVVAGRVREAINVVHQNALVVSYTPPIEGLSRARANDGVDPLDESTEALWRARLERIFAALMAANLEYTQVRLIGIEGNGRELVRVDRTPLGVEAVPEQDLQEKAGEPYFEIGRSLAFGDTLTTRITLNRENGEVDPMRTPTMRTVIPVFTHEGDRYGMIVINLNYEILVQNILEDVSPVDRAVLTTTDGDFAVFEPGSGVTANRFRFDRGYSEHPVFAHSSESFFQVGAFSYASYPAYRSFLEEGLSLDVYVGLPTQEMLSGAINLRTQSIVAGLILTGLAVLSALVFSRGLTRPLISMTQAVQEYGVNRDRRSLPVHRSDEVGDLARAYDRMILDLEASENTTRSIFENVVDGLIVIDQSGRITMANDSLCDMFGYFRDELIGQNVNVLMPKEVGEQHDGYLESYRHTGVKSVIGKTNEMQGRHRLGEGIPIELRVSEIPLGDETFFCGLVRDITERKQMETMKDDFISTVNHELRTPLTSIHGSLNMLETYLKEEEYSEKVRFLLSLARNSSERLTHLVNDILDLEKISAGKMEFRMEILNADDLVRDIVDRHLGLAEQYNVEFVSDLNADGVMIEVDPNRFNQALVNLLSNAAKYSPKNGTVRIRTVQQTDGRFSVSVSDDGPGIPKEFQNRVFERFAQANNAKTDEVGGSGLGLHITKNLIEAFSGDVHYETRVGEGTTFFFVLPVWEKHESRVINL